MLVRIEKDDLQKDAADNVAYLFGKNKAGECRMPQQVREKLNLGTRNTADRLATDGPGILEEIMGELKAKLDDMNFDYYGDQISIAELLAIKDKLQNEDLFAAIESGHPEEHNNITYLPVRIAKILAEANLPQGLNFFRLRRISAPAAAEIVKKEGRIYFFHLNELGLEVAKEFGKHTGQLMPLGINKITDEEAIAMSTQKGGLVLAELAEMSEGVVSAFAQRPGELVLSRRVKKVASGALKMFGKHQGFLNLGIVEDITDEEIEALASHTDSLMIQVENISEENKAKLWEIQKATWRK